MHQFLYNNGLIHNSELMGGIWGIKMRRGNKHDGNSLWTIKFKMHLAIIKTKTAEIEKERRSGLCRSSFNTWLSSSSQYGQSTCHIHTRCGEERAHTHHQTQITHLLPLQSHFKLLEKKFNSLLCSSRIPLFWRYRSNDDSALFFSSPQLGIFFSPLSFSFSCRTNQLLLSICLRKGKSQFILRLQRHRFFFYLVTSSWLFLISWGGKKV